MKFMKWQSRWGVRCLSALVLSLVLALPTLGHAFGYDYTFDKEINDDAAAAGYNTTIYDLYTGNYFISNDLGNGASYQVEFDLTMDSRGKLSGTGFFQYTEPGLELFGPCTVSGMVGGRLGRPVVLFNRVSLLFKVFGEANYDDGVTVHEGLPATAILTHRLFGDYENLAEDFDPGNYLFGSSTLRMNVDGVGRIRYSKIPESFYLPAPEFDPGTWVLSTDFSRTGNYLEGVATVTLHNNRTLDFILTGYYDEFWDEYVYTLRGYGEAKGNFIRFIEGLQPSGEFGIVYLNGRVLRNVLFY
jgi:hypothetical protein